MRIQSIRVPLASLLLAATGCQWSGLSGDWQYAGHHPGPVATHSQACDCDELDWSGHFDNPYCDEFAEDIDCESEELGLLGSLSAMPALFCMPALPSLPALPALCWPSCLSGWHARKSLPEGPEGARFHPLPTRPMFQPRADLARISLAPEEAELAAPGQAWNYGHLPQGIQWGLSATEPSGRSQALLTEQAPPPGQTTGAGPASGTLHTGRLACTFQDKPRLLTPCESSTSAVRLGIPWLGRSQSI